MEAHFRVTDGDAEMPVVFSGILPDLFREKQAVVATGRMRGDGTFVAEQVLAKHDETYVLKEVADKMGLRSEEHTSELQSVMRSSYAVLFLIKKTYLWTCPHCTSEPTSFRRPI